MAEAEGREPHHYLIQRIREAFAHDPRLNELEIEVKVRAGKVFLHGIVPTEERRRAASQIAREVAGEVPVNNQTTVGAFPEPAEHEREELSTEGNER